MYKNYKQLHQILVKHTKVFDQCSRRLPHYTYPEATLDSVKYQHKDPKGFRDRFAYLCIKFIRGSYDMLTSYNPDTMTERKWLNRCIILESVAGVPGMVGGMARHLRSLRTLNRDNGWIHHLLEQADNQRFHLITFLNLRRPTVLERAMIIAIQGIFMNSFFISYVLNPKFSHRFVGYLEEEAVKTYTAMLKDIDRENGPLYHWNKQPAPKEAIEYYHLPETATFRDVVLCIRADEACHRQTNHFLSDVDQQFDIAEEKVKIYEDDKHEEKR